MTKQIYSSTYYNKIQYRDYEFCGEDYEILNYMSKSLFGITKSINTEKRAKFIKKNTGASMFDESYLANNVGFYLEMCKKQLNIA